MKKFIIIHTAFIGDIVLSTPVIEKIKRNSPESEIYYLTTPQGAAVLKNNPDIKEILIYDKKNRDKGFKGFIKIVNKIRELKIDEAIIPHRYLRSSAIAFLAGIKNRTGYDIASGSFLFTKKVEYKKSLHEVERILSLAEGENPEESNIKLYPSKEEVEKVETLWKTGGLTGKKVVVIAPGSKWFTKMWPTEYFNELLKKLALHEEIKVLVIGGKDEESLKIEKTTNVENIIGKSTLLELKAIFDKSDIVVTNDSSPIHIASATKTFIIAIFGATVRAFGFYPWSKNSRVMEIDGLKCRPCGIHGGKSCPEGHFKCMREIKPETVYEEILKRLKIKG